MREYVVCVFTFINTYVHACMRNGVRQHCNIKSDPRFGIEIAPRFLIAASPPLLSPLPCTGTGAHTNKHKRAVDTQPHITTHRQAHNQPHIYTQPHNPTIRQPITEATAYTTNLTHTRTIKPTCNHTIIQTQTQATTRTHTTTNNHTRTPTHKHSHTNTQTPTQQSKCNQPHTQTNTHNPTHERTHT